MTSHARSQYPLRKLAGLYWLDQIPSHWPVQRLKYTIDGCHNGVWGDEPDGGEDDIACVRVADFDRVRFMVKAQIPTTRSVTGAERRRRELRRGDLLLEKSGGGDLQPVGAVALFDHEVSAVCSNFVARMPVEPSCDSRFLSYLHANLYAGRINERSIKQTTGIQNLDADSYLSEYVPLPPLPEQRAIAAFLDRETGRLDALIEKNRRLIQLLQEKRAAVISQAVTKGLDAHAKLKPSGINWLGQVPHHWGVAPLTKYLESIVDYRGATPQKVDDGAFLVTTRNIRSGRIDYETSQEHIDPADYELTMRRGKPRLGDVLFTMEAPLGQTANVDREDVALAQRIVKFRPRKDVLDPYFLKYWIMGAFFQQDVNSYSTGSTALGIKASKLGYLRVALPPLIEQKLIVGYLDADLRRGEQLEGRVAELVVRLTEYRSSLISAAVTGQIDVREAA